MASPQQRRASDRASTPGSTSRLRVALIAFAAFLVGGAGWTIWHHVSTTVVSDGAPNWSPDSRHIVFSVEHDKQADLYEMDVDGSNRHALTATPAYEGAPAFSPDGSRIAFETNRDGNNEIYVMDPSGGNLRRLTNNPADDRAPAWSPDGRRIAFMSDRAEAKRFDIYIMNADGSNVERVTTSDMNWEPAFSPDGNRLAAQVGQDVKVIDLTTHAVLRLTFDPQNGLSPTWSPDGKRLAFASNRNGKLELWTMNADGTDQARLVTFASASAIDPRWSPDGSRLVFVYVPDNASKDPQDPQNYAIYVYDLATKRVTRVSP